MKSKGIRIYLASPYSHPDPVVRENRFKQVCQKAGELMMKGYLVFCPIAHSHPISEYGDVDATSHDFWLTQDFAWLDVCDFLYVYKMDGWENSFGVNEEIKYANSKGIPVFYVEAE